MMLLVAVWSIATGGLVLAQSPPGEAWRVISDEGAAGRGSVVLADGTLIGPRSVRFEGGKRLVVSASTDRGVTWEDRGTVDRLFDPSGDLGDAAMLRLPDGTLLISYRRIQRPAERQHDYELHVAISRDDGHTWLPHSIVRRSRLRPSDDEDAKRGLWSTFLFLGSDGSLWCFFDDEDSPHRAGFTRHQWLTAVRWDPKSGRWVAPVTVSRTQIPEELARDGMPCVVELRDGRWLCVFESVDQQRPKRNVIRAVESRDRGRTWSWPQGRTIVYEPPGRHLAISPWVAVVPSGLICVFSSDEDAAKPGVAGTPVDRLELSVYAVRSNDGGASWGEKQAIYQPGPDGSAYMPWVLNDAGPDGETLVLVNDLHRRGFLALVPPVSDGATSSNTMTPTDRQ